MKRNILHMVGALGLLVSLVCVVHAQSRDAMTVDVPFDFVVGKTTLPAGSYTVDRVLSNNLNGLMLRNRDGKSAVVMTALTGSAHGTPRITFARSGDKYLLQEIRTDNGVHRVLTSTAKRSMAKARATTSTTGL